MVIVAAIAMILVIPVAFVHLPALLVVIVVRMAPVTSLIGWPLPYTRPPDIPAAHIAPIPFSPHIAFTRHFRANFVAERRRGSTNVNSNLSNGWRGQGSDSKAACK